MHTGKLQYHLVWCTKYRRDVLTEEVSKEFKDIVLDKSEQKGFVIHAIETMSDHVHLFVEADSRTNVKYIVNQLKGVTSNKLRAKFKHLRTRIPTLWTRSYYAGTIGHVSEETIKNYIENQRNI